MAYRISSPGPNELSIIDACVLRTLMGNTGLPKGSGRFFSDCCPPATSNVYLRVAYDGRSGYSTHRALLAWRDPILHAQRRKPWARGLSTAALKDYEPDMIKRTAQLVDLLLKKDGQTIDLSETIKFFAYVSD